MDGQLVELESVPKLAKTRKHSIEAVVDRLVIDAEVRSRLTDSVELALTEGCGLMVALVETTEGDWEEHVYSEQNACTNCGISFDPFEARHFSFNSPYGACTTCHGLGTQLIFDESLMVPDRSVAWTKAIHPLRYGGRRVVIYHKKLLEGLSQAYGIDSDVPYESLQDEFREVLLQGSGSVEIEYYMRRRLQRRPFEGVIPMLMRRLEDNESEGMSHWLRDYMIRQACPGCAGDRLQPAVLACRIQGRNIREIIGD